MLTWRQHILTLSILYLCGESIIIDSAINPIQTIKSMFVNSKINCFNPLRTVTVTFIITIMIVIVVVITIVNLGKNVGISITILIITIAIVITMSMFKAFNHNFVPCRHVKSPECDVD